MVEVLFGRCNEAEKADHGSNYRDNGRESDFILVSPRSLA
jgi:hypothetical protein